MAHRLRLSLAVILTVSTFHGLPARAGPVRERIDKTYYPGADEGVGRCKTGKCPAPVGHALGTGLGQRRAAGSHPPAVSLVEPLVVDYVYEEPLLVGDPMLVGDPVLLVGEPVVGYVDDYGPDC